MIPLMILCVHLCLTSVYCIPCDHERAWKCPNDTLCLDKLSEVCAPPPRNIQRCPNGGDYGDQYCPKDNDDEKKVFQTKCDLAEVAEKYFDRYYDSSVYPRPGRNCTCPSITNNTTSCSSYCDKLQLTKEEIEEYGGGYDRKLQKYFMKLK